MDANQILRELDAIEEDQDFAVRSAALVESWNAAGLGVEAVEPVLRFMESHPDVDFGTPGPLVHFVERFHRCGYEQLLLNSMARRPTRHTTWMLNRLINGTRDEAVRRDYVQAMAQASTHALVDPDTVEQVRRFLARGS